MDADVRRLTERPAAAKIACLSPSPFRTNSASRPAPRFAAATLSLAAMAATFVMRWPWRLFPIGYDESVWGYIAQQTLAGGFVPYRDVIDNKPPLVYLPFFLSEIFAGHGDRALRTTGVLLHVLIVGLLVWVLCRVIGPLGAATVGAAEAVLGATPRLEGDYLLQSELQIQLALIGLLWAASLLADAKAARSRRAAPALMGALCAVAFLTKQTHLILAPGFFALAVFEAPAGKRLRNAMTFLGAFAASALVVLLPFATAGAMGDLVEGVFLHNTRHVVALPTWGLLVERLRDVFSNQMPLVVIGLAGGVVAVLRASTRIPSAVSWLFLLAGAVAVIAGGDRLYRHYFLLLSFPLHLLLGCGVAALPPWPRRLVAAAVMIFVSLGIPGERRLQAEVFKVTPPSIDPEPLAFLASHRTPGEAVFFEWQPDYYETGIRAPHRYISTDHFSLAGYERERDEVRRVLESTRVEWIVTRNGTSSRDWGLAGIIASRYSRVFETARGAVYRRR